MNRSCFIGLLVANEDGRKPLGQVLIPPMGHRKPGMSLLVMQEHQCSTSTDHSQTPDETARDHVVGIDRFAVPINVKSGGLISRAWHSGSPEIGSPSGQSLAKALSAVGLRYLGKEPLRMNVSVGTMPSREQRQHIGRVATQLPRAMKPNHSQKQQRQQQTPA